MQNRFNGFELQARGNQGSQKPSRRNFGLAPFYGQAGWRASFVLANSSPAYAFRSRLRRAGLPFSSAKPATEHGGQADGGPRQEHPDSEHRDKRGRQVEREGSRLTGSETGFERTWSPARAQMANG